MSQKLQCNCVNCVTVLVNLRVNLRVNLQSQKKLHPTKVIILKRFKTVLFLLQMS